MSSQELSHSSIAVEHKNIFFTIIYIYIYIYYTIYYILYYILYIKMW